MPLPEMTSIFSSHVDSIGHDGADMYVKWDNGKVSRYKGVPANVKWDNGKVSRYKGVPANVADDVSKSWSVGSALREMVKDKFPHEYVNEDE